MKIKQTVAITSWAEEERPREKLMMWGKNALSVTELMAIIIGSGNRDRNAVELARQIVSEHPIEQLAYLKVADLCKYDGIGKAKAISIIAALELGKRCSEEKLSKPKKITTSTDVYNLLKEKFDQLKHEEFWMVFLNTRCKVIAIEMISKGGIAQTTVDPVIVLNKAIGHMARGIVLAHNHPSGSIKFSEADKLLTKRIGELCKLLNINLLDHVIFTDHGFTSFADEGLL